MKRDGLDLMYEMPGRALPDLGFRIVRDEGPVVMVGTTHRDGAETVKDSRVYQRDADDPRQVTGIRLTADNI
jgi:hypothetical protein